MACRKNTTFNSKHNINDIYTYFENIKRLGKFHVAFVKRDEKFITLIHKAGFKSNGERILLSLENSEGGGTIIHAASESLAPFQLFDWGRNSANLAKIKEYLT